VTAPPGAAATAAPPSPAMKAPEAATPPLGAGCVVPTGLAVVGDEAAGGAPVVAGADDPVGVGEVVAEDGGADVDSAAPEAAVVGAPPAFTPPCDEPDEQAVPTRARLISRASSFIAAHLTARPRRP
jgi:hypothetical protein